MWALWTCFCTQAFLNFCPFLHVWATVIVRFVSFCDQGSGETATLESNKSFSYTTLRVSTAHLRKRTSMLWHNLSDNLHVCIRHEVYILMHQRTRWYPTLHVPMLNHAAAVPTLHVPMLNHAAAVHSASTLVLRVVKCARYIRYARYTARYIASPTRASFEPPVFTHAEQVSASNMFQLLQHIQISSPLFHHISPHPETHGSGPP